MPSIGPRKPWDETDLQVVSVARSPQYPRYAAEYTSYQVTDPSGFGPYLISAATSLGDGQTADTQRFPNVGDAVTYTATVRNRGSNAVSEVLCVSWQLDGAPVAADSQSVTLAPGNTTTFTYVMTWDNQPHDLTFTIDTPDARPDNNSLTTNTLAVPFLTYIDKSFVESFRDEWSPNYPGRKPTTSSTG